MVAGESMKIVKGLGYVLIVVMLAGIASVLLWGCVTASSSAWRPADSVWPDTQDVIKAVGCAIVDVDHDESLANDVMRVKVYARENFERDTKQRALYHPTDAGATITTDVKHRDAWHSPIPYELLCRRRIHLQDHDVLARRCTPEAWDQAILPRYAEAIARCRNPDISPETIPVTPP